MRALIIFFMLVSGLVGGVGTAYGQERSTEAGVAPLPGFSTDYQLGPGDLVSIHVSGLREFERSARVSNSGRIRVPYVGVMFVAGMTAVQVEREIARLIKEHELISEPSVLVQVDQYRSQVTYVIGEVTSPGQYVINSEMYLLDLISKGGGLLSGADVTGYLYRRPTPKPGVAARIVAGDPATPPSSAAVPGVPGLPVDAKAENVVRIDFDELRNGTKPELNLKLEGGDILFVPRRPAAQIFVIGDVRVPGAYTLPRKGAVTAAQAIIYAGGTLATAKTTNGFLMRHDAAGVRQAVPVDFEAIIAGKQADIPVLANDIIFIPNSNVKTIGVGLLNLVPRLLQQFLIF